MIFDFLNPLITQLFEISRDKWNDSETFQNLRMAVRDRLRRETKLNAELLKKFCKKKEIDVLLQDLSTDALEEIFNMPIPIKKILDKNINIDDTPAIHSILTKTKKHAQWTANIKHEADLVERVWQRTRMFNIQIKNRNGNPDISYLRMLNRALNQALEED